MGFLWSSFVSTPEHGTCPGVWLTFTLSHHWVEPILSFPVGTQCKKILSWEWNCASTLPLSARFCPFQTCACPRCTTIMFLHLYVQESCCVWKILLFLEWFITSGSYSLSYLLSCIESWDSRCEFHKEINKHKNVHVIYLGSGSSYKGTHVPIRNTSFSGCNQCMAVKWHDEGKSKQLLRKSVVYMTVRFIWGQLYFPRRIHQPPSPVRRAKNCWMTDQGPLLSSTSFSSPDFLYAFLKYSPRNFCSDSHKVTETWPILLCCRYVRKDALFWVFGLRFSLR